MNEILKFAASKLKPCPSSLIITPTNTILRILRDKLSKQQQTLTQLQLLSDSIPLHVCEKYTVLGPVIGMDAINLALSPLIIDKIKKVTFIGIAGTNKYKIGEIVQGAIFKLENGNTFQNNSLLEKIKEATVLTVQDPYKANRDMLNCDIIEMESAQIAKLCITKNIPYNTIFCISDVLSNEQWKSGFGQANFKTSLEQAIDIAIKNAA